MKRKRREQYVRKPSLGGIVAGGQFYSFPAVKEICDTAMAYFDSFPQQVRDRLANAPFAVSEDYPRIKRMQKAGYSVEYILREVDKIVAEKRADLIRKKHLPK